MNVLRAPLAFALVAALTLTAQAEPFATGKAKFLGSCYSDSQKLNFESYWNQVTPENAGKWGSVEGTRDVMNWTALDAAYAFAKKNGFPFKLHTLIWGSQQPTWIETLSAAEQLEEIEEWIAAVAARYPDVEMIDVVNEPINAPPNKVGAGNYLNALGGTGTTGWDWAVKAFRLARTHFPNAKLFVNEYNVTSSSTRAATYVQLINVLKAQGLIDGVGIQAHAFSTTVSASTTKTNLDTIAAPGVPVYISELDIDGATDQIQLDEYKRVFPIFWEHTAVKGVTLWGFRTGLWRNAQGAYLITENGTERPALLWLKDYIAASPSGGPLVWTQPRAQAAAYGAGVTFRVSATGATAYQWTKDGTAIPGANGATLTLTNVQASDSGQYRVVLTGPGGVTTTDPAQLEAYQPGAARFINIATRSYVGDGGGVQIGSFVLGGSTPKTLLIRASGPGLIKFSVPGTLADPMIELYSGQTVIASNNDWGDDATAKALIKAAAQSAGAFAWDDGSKDAALLVTLQPGAYTAQVKGRNGGMGVALVEAYDIEGAQGNLSTESKLINIATRSLVRKDAEVQIASFVIRGTGLKRVLLRAGGPALNKFSVPGVLADPMLEVNSDGKVIASNDDWNSTLRSEFQKVGGDYWEVGSKDAAILVMLAPGPYTVIVSGKDGGTGVALVEAYEMD